MWEIIVYFSTQQSKCSVRFFVPNKVLGFFVEFYQRVIPFNPILIHDPSYFLWISFSSHIEYEFASWVILKSWICFSKKCSNILSRESFPSRIPFISQFFKSLIVQIFSLALH